MGWFSTDDLVLGRRFLFNSGLRQKRRGHIYVVGASGTGKTSAIYNYILQDMKEGRGVGVVDVHGDLSRDLEKAIYHLLDKEEKRKRVTILDPTRGSFGFNPLEIPPGEDPYPYILEIHSVFETLWNNSWGQRMSDILRNTFLALAEKGLTFCQIPRFLTDEYAREKVVRDLNNQDVRHYWEHRFGGLTPKTQNEWVESSLNKVNHFISDPIIKKVVGQRHSTIDLRRIMDNPEGSILIISLPKGIMKTNTFLLGALLVSKLQEEALSRTEIPQSQRRKFHFYIDEFQALGAGSLNFEEILSESRKYGLSLTLAHQNLDQIDRKLLASILGNTACQIVFRTSRKDGEILAKETFNISIDDLQWERENNESNLSLGDRWEENFNNLTTLDKRMAYVVKKGGRGTDLIRTLDTEDYEATPRQLSRQAETIMDPYVKSEEELEEEREELAEELEPKKPTYKG